MHNIYMDYNATSPVRKEAVATQNQVAEECFANAGSTHFAGRRAKKALDRARESLTDGVGLGRCRIVGKLFRYA